MEQRPEEGTAEELYQKIQVEKQRLIKAGKIKKEKPLPEIAEDEMPFEIPESWKWVRLGSILYKLVDGTHRTPKYTTSGIPFVSVRNISSGKLDLTDTKFISEEEHKLLFERCNPEKGDILLSKVGTTGVPAKVDTGAVFSLFVSVALLKFNIALIDIDFLIYAILTPDFQKQCKEHTRGVGNKNWVIADIASTVFPLPPFAEQKRIVAKIEKLLPYIDRYEQAWSRLEDFSKRFPGDMKKSILQLAIQGKLVGQRPEEGTADELYQQIQAEKQRLIKAGKIKKEKPLPEITEDEKPFDIPESWKWVRLADLCKSISDGDHQPPPQVLTGIPFLVISNISSGRFVFSNTRYVPQSYFDALPPDRVAENGDILFTVTGSYGIPVKVDCGQRFCFQRHIALLKLLIDWEYLFYILKSPIIQLQCDSIATGTAQKTVGLKSLRNMVLPLPPLAEQKRIVAKLEELLPLCEKMK